MRLDKYLKISRLIKRRTVANEACHAGRVLVNDQVLSEDYILEKTRGDYPKSSVPYGTVFVMGDNRNNSEDSRFADVGFVPDALIKGKAVLVFWPVADLKSLP